VALKVLYFCGHWCLEVDAMIPRSFCTWRPSFVRLAGLLLVSLLIPSVLAAQATRAWAVHHDHGEYEVALSVAADAAGNSYVTGVTTAGATNDVLTVKYNSQGVAQWAVTYDGGDADSGHAVAVDASGNVYVTGESWTENGHGPYGHVLVLKYNASGVEQWALRYVSGSSMGRHLAVDGSGNAYVAAEYYSDDDRFLMMTLKVSTAGALQWIKFPNVGYDYEEHSLSALALDSSGNAYVTGHLYKPLDGGDQDYLTVKYSPSGAALWTRTYDAGGNESASDVAVDGSGNVHVSGMSGIIRYNSAGTQQWIGAFNGIPGALINVGGFVYAVGSSGSDIVTAGYDGTGARLWSTSFDLGGNEAAYDLRLVGDSIYAAGRSNMDALLVSFDKDSGASTLADLYDSGAEDFVISMAFAGTGDLWVAGRTGPHFLLNDTLTIKYTVPSSGPALSALTLSPAAFAGGCKTSTGKVTLTGPAPAGGAVVSLADTNPAASLPASVTVPTGATTATFTITGVAVTSNQTGTVTASYGSVSKSAVVTVRPIGVASVSISPNPVVGPSPATGTVTLECPAAPGNIVVTLTSGNTAVANVVPSIRVPAGATSAPFHVSTADVSVVSYSNIRATANGVWKAVRLQVNP
jgi:hypothetical protein